MSHSTGLHLKIAEWILELGEAVSAYDVSEKFGLTVSQARVFMTVLEKDNAIETQRGADIPSHASGRYGIRTLKVTAIDHEKLASHKKNPSYTNYKYHPLKSTSNLTRVEKWELIFSHARRRRR
ncbi:FaeA/PapI family transcriptional regulator [Salmonella enterica]|nr:hypothetical protein [Salmonella enterica]EEH5174106.1 hypothetical protein [Salmonella enterica]